MASSLRLCTLVSVLVLLSTAFAAAAGAQSSPADRPPDRPAEKVLSRDERVRLLQQRTWDVTALRAQSQIRVDGRLDEADWALASPVADFYQNQRNEGLPATEHTEVRVLYDATNLYVGFHCEDRQPRLIRARGMFRDESGGSDDMVAIMVDAYSDHRSAIQFVTNVNGLLEDLLQLGETDKTRNHDFDTVWSSRGQYTADGYDIEVGIPFKSLRFAPPEAGKDAVFGIGFKRNIPRKNEEDYWPFVSNNSTWYRPAELGHVHGLRQIKPGRAIEARPYVLGGEHRNDFQGTKDGRYAVGADFKWGVTPSLTADFTVNTDFAQEEVDAQQINFTRFSLFFPEKRQLFLEQQQMFQFGVSKEADLVFTRRIGLSAAGEMIPILGGARLAGRQGRTMVGLLSMQTKAAQGAPSENFSVIRVRHDLFSRSSIGALFTNVQGGGQANRVVGADANFFFKRVWFIEGWGAAMTDSVGSTHSGAGYARFAYDSDRYGATYRLLDIGTRFQPAIGYIQRPDSRQHRAELRFSPRPKSDVFRQCHFEGQLAYITDQHHVLETREQRADVQADLETGDQVGLTVTNSLESISQPFRLRPTVTIAPGAYRSTVTTARLNTFRRRPLQLNVSGATGGYWGGERSTVSMNVQYRVNKHVGVSGNYEVNWIDLPQGRFHTQLVSGRLQLPFRNTVALMSLFQYNRDTRQLSSNVRFQWIVKPGSDLFVVYNELDSWAGFSGARNRSLTIKMNYLLAF